MNRHYILFTCAVCIGCSVAFTPAVANPAAVSQVLSESDARPPARPASLQDCDTIGTAVLLQGGPATDPGRSAGAGSLPAQPAQAYWLHRSLIAWPQAQAGAALALYHSASGQIVATPGSAVAGFDGVVALERASSDVSAPVSAPASAPVSAPMSTSVPRATTQRFKFVKQDLLWAVPASDLPRMAQLLRQQLVLVQTDATGKVLRSTRIQVAGALDDLYAAAANVTDLGVTISVSDGNTGPHVASQRETNAHVASQRETNLHVASQRAMTQAVSQGTQFKLWAPTAQAVSACVYASGVSSAGSLVNMAFDRATGVWAGQHAMGLQGHYYRYLVDVFVPGQGVLRNGVTDPYAVSATTDSRRSYVANLDAPVLKPPGWDQHAVATRVQAATDMVIYELHVRDFSINDPSVSAAHRGKYLAFTERQSRGMKHLRGLAKAGLTDVHLLPVFDIATIPEKGCTTPLVPSAAPDSEAQQNQVMAAAAKDCFNWGYDPFHYSVPEGSYATDAADGAKRIIEFRRMVMALHAAGLRVGMDVVYNHTSSSGQDEKSVLDRIVPGYYHRLNSDGVVERSTCCDNTATEHLMMGKLMVDSAALWTRHYKIDSFRFDLMAHQPRAVMEQLQARVNAVVGHPIQLLGEGWNFGEVENGARFVQASQLSLGGSGIGTFSDRARDAVRGGGASDSGDNLVKNQGYINGLFYDPNGLNQDLNAKGTPARGQSRADLLRAADMVRVGLAGSLRNYAFTSASGERKPLQEIDYGGAPAGYVGQPTEVVNYVENHDNETLFDINAYRLPQSSSRSDRARVQMLGAAINMFSQGVAYFHAGVDTLRSKSLDRNSFDSGDWFNRIDWSLQDNYFGTGAPPKADNAGNYAWSKPRLADERIKPEPRDIAWTHGMFQSLLKIRASSSLLRLKSASDIAQRLTFFNVGPNQEPTVLVGHLNGRALPDYQQPPLPNAGFGELIYLINVDTAAHTIRVESQRGKNWVLHPVQKQILRGKQATGAYRVRASNYQKQSGEFLVEARTAAVFVLN